MLSSTFGFSLIFSSPCIFCLDWLVILLFVGEIFFFLYWINWKWKKNKFLWGESYHSSDSLSILLLKKKNMWESLSVLFLFWTWMSYLPLLFFFLAEIPENEYIKYFSPDFSLRIPNGHIVCHQLDFIILHYTLFKRLDFFFLWTNLIAIADVGSM